MESSRRRLVLSSALVLFLELALIRWLGSNVIHLSYFTNFVLLGSFLGVGLGFLLSRTERSIARFSPWVLAALVEVVLAFPVQINQSGAQVIYFTGLRPTGPPPWIALPIIFAAVAATLMGPAEIVGRCFKDLKPLDAYRLDIVGSLLGIGAFTGLSFLRAPSVVWGIVAAAAYLVLLRPFRMVALACALLVAVLAFESLDPSVSWSPYYKIEVSKGTVRGTPYVGIRVNGVPHQVIVPAASLLRLEPIYGLPYVRLRGNRVGRVLIVGAGNGNDVAIALRKGAKHVDAVEIDPRILEIGKEENPDRPYEDPRVIAHVDDGRAFLERTDAKYDLILFALPDSLALVTGAGTVRLESYLFTREALASVRAHLAPGGGFAMYNFYRQRWLVDRLAGTVAQVFGHEPCVDRGGTNVKGLGGRAVITAALDARDQSCAPGTDRLPVHLVAPATDDKPFPYFRGGFLPAMYLFALGGVLLVSLVAVRLLGGPFRQMRPYADLFFMGAAFLLLETKSVTTFALLFGTTWIVNAIVFAGVLAAVLLAVETTRRVRTPPLPLLYLGILGALALAFVVPNAALLALALEPRLVTAVALAFAPIYIANLAFSKRFAVTSDSRIAFAVNVLGAMVGGCLEYLALMIGYRDLLIVVGLLYLAAFFLTPRRFAVA
jgi:SAM-dependent methyltransferase